MAAEQMERARRQVEQISENMEHMVREWTESEEFWNGGLWDRKEEYEKLRREYRQWEEQWHERCLEWEEAFCTTG